MGSEDHTHWDGWERERFSTVHSRFTPKTSGRLHAVATGPSPGPDADVARWLDEDAFR